MLVVQRGTSLDDRARLGSTVEADVSGLAPGVYVVRAGGQAAVVTVRRLPLQK